MCGDVSTNGVPVANETILIVDEDEKIQKVLEVSLKKAGYRILICDSPNDALDVVKKENPDLIISETGFGTGDGFDFLAKLKAGDQKNTPFIFLTDDRALPQKMKGFELGADDYLTKPFYLKEITTRADLLIQRSSEDIITQDNENEFSGQLANVGVVDLLQKLEAEKSSGSIQIQRNEHNASIYFKNGNIFDAFCGKLSGEDAIYRLFFWPDGEFIVRYYDIGKRKDRIPKNCSELLIDGMDKLSRYQEISSTIELNDIYDLDFETVAKVRSQLPKSVAEIFRLFNGERSVRDVIDSSTIDDVSAIQIVKRVIDEGLVITTNRSNVASEQPNLATWLEEKEPVFGTGGQESSLGEETSNLTFQTKSELDEPRPDRKTERILESQSRRTTDQQHTVKPVTSIKTIEEIEHLEAERRAVEAQHLSGQHQAVAKTDVEDPEPKRKRRQTPIRSQAHVSATDLEIELSEIEEDEATTAEIPNAAEAYASMQQAHLGTHVSEADTFEDSEPIDEEQFEDSVFNERSTFDLDSDSSDLEEEVPSTERPTKEIERVSVSDPEISEVEDADADKEKVDFDTEDTENEDPKNHTPFYSAAVDSPEEQLPLVERNATDGEMVSASFEIGKTEKPEPKNIVDAPKKDVDASSEKAVEKIAEKESIEKEKESGDSSATDEVFMDDFFNSEPDEDLAEEAPTNYWIPILLGVLVIVGGYFLVNGKKSETEKPKEVVEKPADVEPKKIEPVEPIEIKVDPKIAEQKLANDAAQVSGNDGATNIEENSLTLALHLSESQEPVETEAEKLEREAAEKAQLEADEKAKLEAEKLEAAKQKELANTTKTEDPKEKEEPKEKVEKVEKEEKPEGEKTDASFDKRLKAATALVKKRKWSKALVALRKLSSEKSGSAKIAYLHGRAAFEARSNSEAIKQFSRAQKLGYRSASMMLDLAAAYQLDGNRGKAKAAYESFLKLQPTGQRAEEVKSILANQF